MTKLQAIQIDENTVIYIEATDDIQAPPLVSPAAEGGERVAKGAFPKPIGQVTQNFQAIESTIRAYTTYTLKAFRELAIAEVKKVNLEFGLNVSGIGGIPYIATGTAGCNIKITVECAFPEPEDSEQEVKSDSGLQ